MSWFIIGFIVGFVARIGLEDRATNSNGHPHTCECWYCEHGVIIGRDS